MKMITFSVLITIVLYGCIPSTTNFVETDYALNEIQEVTVGSSMMSWAYGTERTPGLFEEGVGTTRDGIRKELVYSGIGQDILKVTYREYAISPDRGELARSSFYQNLEYTIEPGETITFQDVVIRVHSYTSDKIEYEILQGPKDVDRYSE